MKIKLSTMKHRGCPTEALIDWKRRGYIVEDEGLLRTTRAPSAFAGPFKGYARLFTRKDGAA